MASTLVILRAGVINLIKNNGFLYDDAVERKVLTQENFIFFTRNVHKLTGSRIVTARRVFYDLPTSAEA